MVVGPFRETAYRSVAYGRAACDKTVLKTGTEGPDAPLEVRAGLQGPERSRERKTTTDKISVEIRACPRPASSPVCSWTRWKCKYPTHGEGVMYRTAILVFGLSLVVSNAGAQCTQCRGDLNGDNQVTVDEILTAVDNALNGCPIPPTIKTTWIQDQPQVTSFTCSREVTSVASPYPFVQAFVNLPQDCTFAISQTGTSVTVTSGCTMYFWGHALVGRISADNNNSSAVYRGCNPAVHVNLSIDDAPAQSPTTATYTFSFPFSACHTGLDDCSAVVTARWTREM